MDQVYVSNTPGYQKKGTEREKKKKNKRENLKYDLY